VYCGKTADWIRVPFGVQTLACRGMGVLDGGGDRQRERGSYWGKCGTSRGNKWGLCYVVLRKRRALPKLLRDDLLFLLLLLLLLLRACCCVRSGNYLHMHGVHGHLADMPTRRRVNVTSPTPMMHANCHRYARRVCVN